MDAMQVNDRSLEWAGQEWIRALVEKDFQRITRICQPEVHSRLMTPKQIFVLENASDLTQKVEGWFQDCTSFKEELSRVATVGEKLGIFYRLSLEKNGQPNKIEQQIYCSFRDGLIDQLSLVCSGFQPVRAEVGAPADQTAKRTPIAQQPIGQSSLHVDAFLKFETTEGQGSTCALLTPSIKHKLGQMNSGQVLEVQVNDPAAREDIESWSRLSGNSLLKIDQNEGQELHFYLLKK